MNDDPVGFGGGNEDGLLCGCGRRVRTPHCPWCGKRMDDDGAQLLAYLQKAIVQNKKSADARAARPRTSQRLLDRADQQTRWANWVLKQLGGQ